MQRFRTVVTLLAIVAACFSFPVQAQETSAEKDVIKLLHEFLNKVDDPAMHDRFWADDLIYTSGKGVKRSKADIMKSMRESSAKSGKPSAEGTSTYDAQDITTHVYPRMVVLNFRLVQHLQKQGQPEETHTFRNTGIFLQRDGKWQVVAWQATPEQKQQPEEQNKK